MLDELDIGCDLWLRSIKTFYSKVRVFPSYKYTSQCNVNHSNCIFSQYWLQFAEAEAGECSHVNTGEVTRVAVSPAEPRADSAQIRE